MGARRARAQPPSGHRDRVQALREMTAPAIARGRVQLRRSHARGAVPTLRLEDGSVMNARFRRSETGELTACEGQLLQGKSSIDARGQTGFA